MKTWRVIGIMSGTSLDGIDIAYCHIRFDKNRWGYEIVKAEIIHYSPEWKERLIKAPDTSGLELTKLDLDYGKLIGEKVIDFIQKNELTPDFIASHGHTVFHQPEKRITLQIGNASAIAGITRLPVVNDFRSLDVALGGQGAPLVPIGDRLLFSHHEYCLNLGGFANVSFEKLDDRIAFDICPVNMALNHITRSIGKDFDANGDLARQGNINKALLEKLNSLSFYDQNPPKSLGREWYEQQFLPVIDKAAISIPDQLRTLVEHIAIQIGKVTHKTTEGSLFITGGGVYNDFLIERINANTKLCIEIPDDRTIQYKEALIFGLLGVLRMEGKTNVLKSVTGGKMDHCGGAVYRL
ncbi:MAG: anhydro-N-acetylmuramic acid kinase [Bacteroidales bacterium]|nr:anhydro-N-acetylmuramic acid kinase [Bacteroidales bacterium]